MDRSGESTLRLVIFDLDGVMYRGRQPVPGAAVLVAALRERGLLIRLDGERRADHVARDPSEVASLLDPGLS